MARLLITPGTAEPAAPDASEARPGLRRASRRWVVLLVAGWLCQAGLRAWFGRMQVMPLANPDETAYLIAARVLAGGPGANLSGSTLYPGGYPLLITPVYWFTSNPATVYHAVLMINAAISAAILPLGYLACRRLGLDRPAAYGVATVAALVPAGFFYSQYAMTDAVFPVITLAWLLATHSWLTASSARSRYAAAAGSALLAGFAYMVHSRGLVLLAGYAAVGAFIAWRRPAARGSVAAAALIALGVAGAAWGLNHYLASAIYPEGARSLSGQMASRLHSVQGTIHALEMAAGQLWRLVLDSWGIAGIGLVAALAVVARRGVRTDLRIMAGLAVAVTAAIACTAPAALPADQTQTWASGRYLDGMIVTFFLVGAVVLLRAGSRPILGCAFGTVVSFVVAAVTVAIYAGSSLPTSGFGSAFNFAEPAVLTQNWTQASVLLATAVTLGLLACWVAFALAARRWRAVIPVFGACVAAVSLVAVAQMTSQVSQASTVQAQAVNVPVSASGVRPGEQVAVSSDLGWQAWVPLAYQVSWTELQFFDPASQSPPAGVAVVEMPWPDGQSAQPAQPAQASWPHAPAGWRIAASNPAGGWVLWRRLEKI
ncbi:MAG: hypothetical protein ACLQB1_17725 [Streptosporangiaceae bacterium]